MSMIRKYHNHKPKTALWHREEEPLNHHEAPGRQIKQSNQLSLPHQDDCNTRILVHVQLLYCLFFWLLASLRLKTMSLDIAQQFMNEMVYQISFLLVY